MNNSLNTLKNTNLNNSNILSGAKKENLKYKKLLTSKTISEKKNKTKKSIKLFLIYLKFPIKRINKILLTYIPTKNYLKI